MTKSLLGSAIHQPRTIKSSTLDVEAGEDNRLTSCIWPLAESRPKVSCEQVSPSTFRSAVNRHRRTKLQVILQWSPIVLSCSGQKNSISLSAGGAGPAMEALARKLAGVE